MTGFIALPFTRILVPFAAGIILAEYIPSPKSFVFIFLLSGPYILFLLYPGKKTFSQDTSTGSLILISFLLLGYSRAVFKRYDPSELSLHKYYAVLEEYPIERNNSFRAVIKIVDPEIKAIAYFDKSDQLKSVQPGMVFYFSGDPVLIKNLGNPFEFNYQLYSRRNEIGHRIYLKAANYHFLKSARVENIRYSALIFRQKLLETLEKAGIKGETFRVISAITLGARDNLDPETTRSFTRTGTIHVLAVSGGNVAVIYFFLFLLFGFLNQRRTILLFTLLILMGIWAYTFITGLSPSVLRAAIMFSFIILGKSLNRNPDIYNSLASSAFVLLFFKPSLLYDVGFQLSYAAVFAIVFLHPFIYKLCFFKYWIPDKIWMFFTISIAAQIGTLPFSLWYFHQFPVYFWFTNVLVVPLVSLFLYLTFLIILLGNITPVLVSYIALLLSWTGDWMLKFLHFAEYLPYAVIENIYLSAAQLSIALFIVVALFLYFIYRKALYAFITVTSLILLLLLSMVSEWQIQRRKEILVFNDPGNTLLAFTKGRETIWVSGHKMTQKETLQYLTKPYEGFRRITKSSCYFIGDSSNLKNRTIAIKNNFINFCQLRIFVSSIGNELLRKDFPEIDILLVNRYQGLITRTLTDTFEKITVIKAISPLSVYGKNNYPPEDFSSGEQAALRLKLNQNNEGKTSFQLKSW